MKVYVVTTNRCKYLEIEDILEKERIEVVQKPIEVLEHGKTLEQRAKSKAQAGFNVIGRPTVADDTGVYIHAFKDFPGVYPKKVVDEIGLDGIMKRVEGKDRSASFKTVLCYFDDTGPRFFSGVMEGMISERLHKLRREDAPYERIFIPKKMFRAVSELSFDEKQLISHRAKASRKLAEFLKTIKHKQ
jgi:XTP/dITP diphosphohydrolase